MRLRELRQRLIGDGHGISIDGLIAISLQNIVTDQVGFTLSALHQLVGTGFPKERSRIDEYLSAHATIVS